ncbi:MAG TPA: VOC family protein [Polyangiales bacterium]|nr:VOC family protein [Polyangiales bacterium]
MKIKLTSVMVEDQARALEFYTKLLGFTKKQDFPVGEYRWITVVAAGRDDLELVLEPNANAAAKVFQKAMFDQGIPLASFEVENLEAEFTRLKAAGAAFTQPPTQQGPVATAVLSDTCGNLIMLYQPPKAAG